MTTNSTINATDPNQIAFNATPTTIDGHSVAVFSVNQSFFTQSGTISSLTGVTAGETIVINVTGGTSGNDPLNFSSGLNFYAFSNAKDSANILFNFENATALNGVPTLGASILAVNANLSTNNSLVGSVYVKSILNTGEIDQPFSNNTEVNGFTGFVPTVSSVPEPASIVSMLLGIVIVEGAWWRHRLRRSA